MTNSVFKSSRGCERLLAPSQAQCHTARGGAICCQNEKCWVCCDHIILGVAASVHVHVNHNKAACRGRYSDFVSIASRLPGGDVVAKRERNLPVAYCVKRYYFRKLTAAGLFRIFT